MSEKRKTIIKKTNEKKKEKIKIKTKKKERCSIAFLKYHVF